ncbi:hypothetical protein CJU89_4884 [Yarrowia sp. B02]|nr:hypothetical protein CJU89_4884 [Yarrowia sp. B02]
MLNEDVLRIIFAECNLAAALALAQTCKLCQLIFASLDDSWFKPRVLERVPWFTNELGSWKQCALQLAACSSAGLDRKNDNLLLVRDLTVAMARCNNDVTRVASRDIAQDASLRLGMEPMFSEKVDTGVLGDYKMEGTHLVGMHMDLDLRTLMLRPSTFDLDELDDIVPERNARTVSSRGTKVRNQNGWVQIIDENNSLLHVRLSAPEGMADEIVHKDSQEKDQGQTEQSWCEQSLLTRASSPRRTRLLV